MFLRFMRTALCIMICTSKLIGASDLPPALSHMNEVSDTPPTSEIRLPLRTAIHQSCDVPKINVKRVTWERAIQTTSSQTTVQQTDIPAEPAAKRVCPAPTSRPFMSAVRSSVEIDQRIVSSQAALKKLYSFVRAQARESDRLRTELTQLKVALGIGALATQAYPACSSSSSSQCGPPPDEAFLHAAQELAMIWQETELFIELEHNLTTAIQGADEFMHYLVQSPLGKHYVPRVLLAKAKRYYAESLKARAECNDNEDHYLEYALQLYRTLMPLNLSEVNIGSHTIPDELPTFKILAQNLIMLDWCRRCSAPNGLQAATGTQ